MSIKKNICVLLTIASLAGVMAQDAEPVKESDNNWFVGIGLSYRKFDDTVFKGSGSSSATLYEDRAMGAMLESAYSTTRGGREKENVDFSDSLSPMLLGGFSVYKDGSITLSAIAGFQYFSFDNSADVDRVTTVSYRYTAVDHPEFGEVEGESEVVSGSLKTKAELDLYVFDLGLRGDYALTDKFALYLSAGPTINITDFQTKANGVSKSNDDCIIGCYAEAGLSFSITKALAIAADARYDAAFDEAETRFAKQELDGFGASLKFVFSF